MLIAATTTLIISQVIAWLSWSGELRKHLCDVKNYCLKMNHVIISCFPHSIGVLSNQFLEWYHHHWWCQPFLGGCGCNSAQAPKYGSEMMKLRPAQNSWKHCYSRCVFWGLSRDRWALSTIIEVRDCYFCDQISPHSLPEWLDSCALVMPVWGPKSKEVIIV